MQVPLGVLNKSEMKYEDMISIMEHNHQYVATITDTIEVDLPASGHKVEVTKTKFHVFGGDQLTAKRARGSQMIRSNSINSTEQISGLLPTAEDWHAKLCLLQVCSCKQVICVSITLFLYTMILLGNLEEAIQNFIRVRSWNALPATEPCAEKKCGKGAKEGIQCSR